MTAYPRLRCRAPRQLEELLPELLEGRPVLGSHLRPVDGGEIELDVYLEPGAADAAEAVAAALAAAGAGAIEVELVAEEDWMAPYRAAAVPFAVGSLWWLDPRPDSPTPAPEGRLRLVVEPRTAFGSGSHESTRLVLLALEALDVSGRRVLDVGTGSGILAFAAERLGAGWVVAVDVDPEAVWVARETAATQERGSAPRLVVGSAGALTDAAAFDLVLCNMISGEMLPIAGELARTLRPGGRAVLSGLLAAEREEAEARLARHGLRSVAFLVDGEWLCLEAVRDG